MIVSIYEILRKLVVTASLCLFITFFWLMTSATAQPLAEGTLACPAGSPPGGAVGQNLLSALTNPQLGDPLNSAWAKAAPTTIDPFASPDNPFETDNINIGCSNGGNDYCGVRLASCSREFANVKLHSMTGLAGLRFKNLTVTAVNQKDVAAHSNAGPDAGKITDGVFASDGHSATDPAYAIVLPHSANDSRGAVVIDLGSVVQICGNGFDCQSGPVIQADNDDVYQLEYSSDGVNWNKYGQFPTVSGSGLRSRGIATITSGVRNPSFSARYVRVYAVSGGSTFAVSELKLWNVGSQVISVDKPAVGPRPYQITDNILAPEGHSSTDTQYAVVLTHLPGAARALVIDLGAAVQVCGNGFDCLSGPVIQADNDDVYQFDYSSDGRNWTTYPGKFPTVSGSGLRKRTIQCDPCNSQGHAPNFAARYIRVYAVSGGDTFAVSELQLWNTGSNLISFGAAAYGPEPFVTNGDVAPEGTAWNDNRYATVLPICTASNSVCPHPSARTSAVLIDLRESFPIAQLQI
ncbi:MAG: discoidin domain-containing protein, partial [Candidatus Binatia bacterium]